jgi:hypothetical protein
LVSVRRFDLMANAGQRHNVQDVELQILTWKP